MLTAVNSYAGEVTAYVAADCASNSNSTITSYCNGSVYCSTSSADLLPHRQNNTTYKSYQYCTIGKFVDSGETYKYLLCFTDVNKCNILQSCHEDYKGTKPTSLPIENWPTSTGKTFSFNISQYECCNNNYGYVSSPSDLSSCSGDLSTTTIYYKPKTCTKAGEVTTTTAGAYFTCKPGYYSASTPAGYIQHTSSSVCNRGPILQCTKCPAGTYGATEKLGSPSCSGSCTNGKYSLAGATSCSTCTNKPSNSTYTNTTNTSATCKYACNTGYFGDVSCEKCPDSSTGGIYTNSGMTTTQSGTTSSTGSDSIFDCFIPIVGTGYYDATGKFKVQTTCPYK